MANLFKAGDLVYWHDNKEYVGIIHGLTVFPSNYPYSTQEQYNVEWISGRNRIHDFVSAKNASKLRLLFRPKIMEYK